MKSYMSNEEFSKITYAVGLNFYAMARFLRVSVRTVFRYANEKTVKIPSATADLLRLLNANKITLDEIESVRPASMKQIPKKAAKKKTAKKK